MEAPPLPPLLQLPTEILSQIADYFSTHVSLVEHDLPSINDLFKKDNQRSLSRLSRTHPILNDIAQPKLFRTLYVYPHMWLGLLTALRLNEKLRKDVKRIVFPNNRLASHSQTVDRMEGRIESEAAKGLDILAKAGSIDRLKLSQAVTGQKNRMIEFTAENLERHVSTQLLAYPAGTLELAVFDFHSRPFAVYPPGTFPRLFELGYTSSFSNISTLLEVDCLLRSAPSLTTLKVEWLCRVRLRCELDQVTLLHLHDCHLTADSLADLARHLPNLRSLTYDSHNPDPTGREMPEVTPSELFSLLQPWRRTLRELSVHITRTELWDDTGSADNAHFDTDHLSGVDRPEHDLTALTSLEGLEVLILGGIWLSHKSEHQLAQMLPRSLRTLHLWEDVEFVTARHMECLLAVRGEFPNLEDICCEVLWDFTDNRQEFLKKQFAQVGVSASW